MARPISLRVLEAHLAEVKACTRCPEMVGPVVVPRAAVAEVYLVGQAPGPREGGLGRPFAWTAGKQMFRWFQGIGVDEETFRSHAWIAAVCRCFPGKVSSGGDRVPSPAEVDACEGWMRREMDLLRPRLVVPVGRLAIERFLPAAPLAEVIGRMHVVEKFGQRVEVIPLPHPSGASTWYKVEPGRTLTQTALALLGKHAAWRRLVGHARG